MRKIEKEMITAITAGKAWQKDNTQVTARTRIPTGYQSHVFLHGNEIARLYWTAQGRNIPFYVSVSLAGWNTQTTRSRLGAILSAYARIGRWPDGTGVSTRGGQPYLHDANGKRKIDRNGWHPAAMGEA